MTLPGSSLLVYPTTAYPRSTSFLDEFVHLAAVDRIGAHSLTDAPDNADIILFFNDYHADLDPLHKALRGHRIVKHYREKVFAYFEEDDPWCILPGLYCSMPRQRFRMDRQRACIYLLSLNPFIEEASREIPQPDLLYSFVGARTHPVRSNLLTLDHPHGYVEDTTGSYQAFGRNRTSGMDKQSKQRRYAQLTARSKFVLCPRGFGTSSYRLFEALQAGRVPVIISDDWVAPIGPAWESFSIRIPEARASDIPAILEGFQGNWQPLAQEARRAWNEWFTPDVRFHRMVESCAQIYSTRRRRELISQHLVGIQALRKHLYMAARPRIQRIQRGLPQ